MGRNLRAEGILNTIWLFVSLGNGHTLALLLAPAVCDKHPHPPLRQGAPGSGGAHSEGLPPFFTAAQSPGMRGHSYHTCQRSWPCFLLAPATWQSHSRPPYRSAGLPRCDLLASASLAASEPLGRGLPREGVTFACPLCCRRDSRNLKTLGLGGDFWHIASPTSLPSQLPSRLCGFHRPKMTACRRPACARPWWQFSALCCAGRALCSLPTSGTAGPGATSLSPAWVAAQEFVPTQVLWKQVAAPERPGKFIPLLPLLSAPASSASHFV